MSLSHEDLRATDSVGDGDDSDISSLAEMLSRVTEKRGLRGRVYGLTFVLAASLIAVLAGASNYRQIADQVEDFPSSLMRKLKARWCYFRIDFRRPSAKTVRLVLSGIDADQFDAVAGEWIRERAKPEPDGTMTVAIDGKVLRGAWTRENEKFTLFSAMIHGLGLTIAQVQVPAETNEITQVKELLDTLPVRDGERVVVTMDAAHTQRDTAEYIVAKRGFTYIMNVKGNQPTLLESVFRKCLPLLHAEPDHVVEERGHGRVNRWSTWITEATGIDFPHARTIGCIRRDTFNLIGERTSKELAWIISGSSDGQARIATAGHLNNFVREHWGIENKSHYVRDMTWHEDANQAHTESGPQAMATLRNIAAGLIRLNGTNAIKRTTERIARSPLRALAIIATVRNQCHST
ncbi:ISAs1 family transposase [Amycolatopsis sp. H20-H5]|uniref:ISAs1 family transposase n=1 Tax=Amycolatopsis sp. H20-H5 TaxID=3046309 RepID=UPI002DB640AD|nr:ISAs1 family transposase [Amycolatopsis sp. H20-H5]MEC3982865.1 ISAs1 family transposase [Amycolatopsis sp. H20-H5]